jgi:hypothetical protein
MQQVSHLERLSKPSLESVVADECTAEGEERLVNIGAAFVTDRQPPIAVEPGQGALDHPAVATEPFAGVDTLAGDADADVAATQRLATAWVVIPLVGMQLGGALAAPSIGLPDGGNGVEHLLEDDGVVAVGSAQERGERDPGPVDHKMALAARFAAIRWIRAGELAPLLAAMLAESNDARLQSIWSASPKRSSNSRWSRSHTPASCQSRSLRQHVTPEPQPSSGGSNSQEMPDLRTKMIPVRAARSGTRGRPPLGLGGSGGNSGATRAHSSSLTNGLAMPKVYHVPHRF